VSSTFLILGGPQSGKKYTVRGCEHEERGIAVLCVESILNLIEIQKQGPKTSQRLTLVIIILLNNRAVQSIHSMIAKLSI
jgi:hypothetical protein